MRGGGRSRADRAGPEWRAERGEAAGPGAGVAACRAGGGGAARGRSRGGVGDFAAGGRVEPGPPGEGEGVGPAGPGTGARTLPSSPRRAGKAAAEAGSVRRAAPLGSSAHPDHSACTCALNPARRGGTGPACCPACRTAPRRRAGPFITIEGFEGFCVRLTGGECGAPSANRLGCAPRNNRRARPHTASCRRR